MTTTLPPLPTRAILVRQCRCGHTADCHEHLRAGSDCGTCGILKCSAFRPPNFFQRFVLRRAYRIAR